MKNDDDFCSFLCLIGYYLEIFVQIFVLIYVCLILDMVVERLGNSADVTRLRPEGE